MQLFIDCLTQWRTSMAGMTGIDYCALESVMRIRRVPLTKRDALFDDIRVMEAAVIEHKRGTK